MKDFLVIRGRKITDADIGLVRALVNQYSNRSKNYISKSWHKDGNGINPMGGPKIVPVGIFCRS